MEWNQNIPEFDVFNLEESLHFYVDLIGFEVVYERKEDKFAFLQLENVQLMIQEIDTENNKWNTGKLEYPLGVGINFQIDITNIEEIYTRLKDVQYKIFVEMEDHWYRKDEELLGCREFLVQDPNGYLLRFSKDIVENKSLKNLSGKEIKEISYSELIKGIEQLTTNEIIELSNKVGYPVFTRLCMGELKHRFVLLQDGAAAIIVNEKGQILLQSRADSGKWGVPGGCQELGECFEETIIREIKEETNLDVKEEDLELISVVSGKSRRNEYPNGDVVINNTVFYCVKKYSGELKWDEESKEMKFFDLDSLPKVQNDPDLIEIYLKYLKNSENK